MVIQFNSQQISYINIFSPNNIYKNETLSGNKIVLINNDLVYNASLIIQEKINIISDEKQKIILKKS